MSEPGGPPQADALTRVRKYIHVRENRKGLHPDEINGLDGGDFVDGGISLTLTDLRTLVILVEFATYPEHDDHGLPKVQRSGAALKLSPPLAHTPIEAYQNACRIIGEHIIANTKLQQERDYYRKRYELLEELLRGIVLSLDFVGLADDRSLMSASRDVTLFSLLEEGSWRAHCPVCAGIDCAGGNTSRCSQEACERATKALEEKYDEWCELTQKTAQVRL